MEFDINYLQLLAEQYPSIQLACAEIIKMESRQKLPKVTEHYMSDIHGEYESFLHILKNASGVIKDKVNQIYGNTLSYHDRQILSTLIYYPEQKLDIIKRTTPQINDWYKITLYRLIEVCRVVASKYTRARISELLPKDFGYVIDELLHANTDYGSDKAGYYSASISSIIKLGQADKFIVALANTIQALAIGRLHIIGDIYDRGPRADIILDKLMNNHNVDIQWGNHDVQWMGAAAGSKACIANVLCISTKYSNFDCLEDGYGINMRPLTVFALETYGDDPCSCFIPRNPNKIRISKHDVDFWAKMHKAITIIRFKLEGQIIMRRPEFKMEHQLLLDKINYDEGTITLEGKTYPLKDTNFPTIDPANPYELTPEENEMMEAMRTSFMHNEKLQSHVRFLYAKGSMYLCCNNNLLYHGCVPLNSDGTFTEVELQGEKLKGKSLLDKCESIARDAYFANPGSDDRFYGEDFMWFLWCGSFSPVYGKNKMTSFERYFIDDESTWTEIKDPYYSIAENDPAVCDNILREFGIEPDDFAHIINGHVPVKIKKGESPIKAGGKMLIIDGGLSRAYQQQTGIAGYTLLYNSHGLLLSEHEPFESVQSAIKEEKDIHSTLRTIDQAPKRMLVADTDSGKEMQKKINALTALVNAYRKGTVKAPNMM